MLQALEREPAEPRLLNQAGVALYGLGMIEAAAAMLDGAARLDPELDGLQQSRAAIAARRALAAQAASARGRR